ncbi:hypothetical protein HAX54_025644 [Datura stramonium]|uniref:Uncharacterized protein n=1 Tax=Datura stramonium TaxID=4076 RepID=A0ABS8V004_DATST|nr:hypothetical protein [Datura stramonium]
MNIAHDAEDRIESIVGEIYSKKEKSNGRAFKSLFDSLLQASESMDSESKELARCIMKKGRHHNKISLETLPQASSFKSISSEMKELKKHMKKGA